MYVYYTGDNIFSFCTIITHDYCFSDLIITFGAFRTIIICCLRLLIIKITKFINNFAHFN